MTEPGYQPSPAQVRRRAGAVKGLSPAAQVAAGTFAREFQRSTTDPRADERTAASEAVRRAKAVLTDHEALIVQLVAGYGLNVKEVADKTRRNTSALKATYAAACEKLASHYERRA